MNKNGTTNKTNRIGVWLEEAIIIHHDVLRKIFAQYYAASITGMSEAELTLNVYQGKLGKGFIQNLATCPIEELLHDDNDAMIECAYDLLCQECLDMNYKADGRPLVFAVIDENNRLHNLLNYGFETELMNDEYRKELKNKIDEVKRA
jgi:hypothetical protein